MLSKKAETRDILRLSKGSYSINFVLIFLYAKDICIQMRRSRKGEIHGKASQDEGIIINGDKIPMDNLLSEEDQ